MKVRGLGASPLTSALEKSKPGCCARAQASELGRSHERYVHLLLLAAFHRPCYLEKHVQAGFCALLKLGHVH